MISDTFLLEDDDPSNFLPGDNTGAILGRGSFEELGTDPAEPRQESGSLEAGPTDLGKDSVISID